MDASAVDAEPESNFVFSGVDSDTCLRALTQIARSTNDSESLHLLLSSIRIRQEKQCSENSKISDTFYSTPKKRHSNETSVELRAGEKDGDKNKKACRADVDKHAKSAKGNRLVRHVSEYECEKCERLFATVAALKVHTDSCSAAANAPKSPQDDCTLCDKKRTNIYYHYASVHAIECPEEILFYNGNVLVRSDRDTKRGKASWFLQEKEKAMKNNDSLTCRLCVVKPTFDNAAILEDHYTLNHSVHPPMLINLEQLFRADKGAHLVGMPTSQFSQTTCKRRIGAASAHDTTNSKNEKENTRWLCTVCKSTYSNRSNFNKHVKVAHPEKKPEDVVSTKAVINAPKTEDKGQKSMKYGCVLCDKKITSIYKHYGNIHNIDYPEEILFVKGNVLVLSDIDTDCGKAPWFLREVKKVERYTPTTCRLCETAYRHPAILEDHYRRDHKVIQSALECLQHLFRATKGAHRVDLPASQTAGKQRVTSFPPQGDLLSHGSVKKMGCKESSAEHKTQKPGPEAETLGAAGLIMYQCKECKVATPTYDASVEHAQLHHLDGYRPIKETCVICKFDFEAKCYAEHVTAHNDTNEYKILFYDPSKLLNDEWFDVFKGLSENHVNRIKFSSNYHHTRRVKINSDVGSGIPLYQCAVCEFYVRPKDIEDHCNSDKTCVKDKSPNHHCPECDIFFYTLEAAKEHHDTHTEAHKTGGFRKLTFNCKQDSTINKALRKFQHDSLPVENASVRAQPKKKPSVKILQNHIVSVFCNECNKSILYSNFDAHAAAHNNKCVENPSSLDVDHENLGDILTQNEPMKTTEGNGGGTVEPWDSDNDSCHSLQISSVQVQVQVEKEAEVISFNFHSNKDKLDYGNNKGGNANKAVTGFTLETENDNSKPNAILTDYVKDIQETKEGQEEWDDFSKELKDALKRDLQNLRLKEIVQEDNCHDNEYASTQELLEILETNSEERGNSVINKTDQENAGNHLNNDELIAQSVNNTEANVSQDIFSSDPSEIQNENSKVSEISQDIFSEETQNPKYDDIIDGGTKNHIESTKETDRENAHNPTVIEDNDDIQSNPRPSIRNILTRMLESIQSNHNAAAEERRIEEERKMKQQSLVADTQRIKEIMFSRD